jgi:lipoate-protein ligase A
MAVDETLLDSAASQGRPSLRFYQWSEPTLSLGYFQPVSRRALHHASIACPVVRRTTGGGAILHHHDLTYSLALPLDNRWSANATRLYHQVHAALVSALAAWGVETSLRSGSDDAAGPAPFLCFLRHAEGDVLSGQTKIAGSAQRRARGAVLQHGSVLLSRSVHAPELPGIRDLTGRSVEPDQLAPKWSAAMAQQLDVQWFEGSLDKAERDRATRIVARRFGQEHWTNRR